MHRSAKVPKVTAAGKQLPSKYEILRAQVCNTRNVIPTAK